MDLSLTETQHLFVDSVSRYLNSEYPLSHRQTLVSTDLGYSEAHWQTFAELGWTGLALPEAFDGLGGDLIDRMLLHEQLGKGLVLEPFLATLGLCVPAILWAGSDEQKEMLLSPVATGQLSMAAALQEASDPLNLHAIETSASTNDEGFILSGTKSMVLNGAGADYLIASASLDGAETPTLFIIPADAPGVVVEGYPLLDGYAAAEVRFESVQLPSSSQLGEAGLGSQIIDHMIAHGILCVSAEAVGAMEVLYQSTIDYAKERVQFDHPLAEFQVVKHRLTDMFIEYNLAKSMCLKTTLLVNEQSPDAPRHLHGLKYLVGKAGRFIGQNAVQLHGGMGMTEDLMVAHYFKRLTVIDALFGHTDLHLDAFVNAPA